MKFLLKHIINDCILVVMGLATASQTFPGDSISKLSLFTVMNSTLGGLGIELNWGPSTGLGKEGNAR
jgi:hypothetical protein